MNNGVWERDLQSFTRRRQTDRNGRAPLKYNKNVIGFTFVGLSLLGLAIYTYWPIVQVLYFSFCKGSFITKPEWIGTANYVRMWNDPIFWTSVRNTTYFVVATVPVSLLLALALALALNQEIRGIVAMRAIYFLPQITSGASVSLMWAAMFQPVTGVINLFLGLFGIRGPNWLLDPNWSMTAVNIAAVWRGLGGNILLFLAGLQDIPKVLHEAAEIDGAGPMQRLFYITLPLLTPTLFFQIVLGMISAFQVFEYSYMMTGGGPRWSSTTTVYYLYIKSFASFEVGYASAISVAVFVIIIIVTALQFGLQPLWVNYDL